MSRENVSARMCASGRDNGSCRGFNSAAILNSRPTADSFYLLYCLFDVGGVHLHRISAPTTVSNLRYIAVKSYTSYLRYCWNLRAAWSEYILYRAKVEREKHRE